MRIGPYQLQSRLILAPMAGVTDRPFRLLCRRMGAGLAVSEMVSSDAALRGSRKTALRIDHDGEPEPRSIQIAGAEPATMADAARFNVGHGAQIIDINMGCPARKVCNRMAGSALLRDERLVGRILDAVVAAVDVPVTLKIRTGWDKDHRNAVAIARIAENAGVQALAIHGRTRACGFSGDAEFATIAEVKQRISIPVIANGDIAGPEQARDVLAATGADAVMIGRAAQGRPWIFREVQHHLATCGRSAEPTLEEIRAIMKEHIINLYGFYGEHAGVRVARKHIAWYSKGRVDGAVFRQAVNQTESADRQMALVDGYFNTLMDQQGVAA